MLELRDDGRAGPDVTQNDGVYSAYVAGLAAPAAGAHAVSVTAINGGGATVPRSPPRGRAAPRPPGGDVRCCGQSVPYPATAPCGSFVRHAVGTAFFVSGGGSAAGPGGDGDRAPGDADQVPPGRILDLRLQGTARDAATGQWVAELSWTSPGDDYNEGEGE